MRPRAAGLAPLSGGEPRLPSQVLVPLCWNAFLTWPLSCIRRRTVNARLLPFARTCAPRSGGIVQIVVTSGRCHRVRGRLRHSAAVRHVLGAEPDGFFEHHRPESPSPILGQAFPPNGIPPRTANNSQATLPSAAEPARGGSVTIPIAATCGRRRSQIEQLARRLDARSAVVLNRIARPPADHSPSTRQGSLRNGIRAKTARWTQVTSNQDHRPPKSGGSAPTAHTNGRPPPHHERAPAQDALPAAIEPGSHCAMFPSPDSHLQRSFRICSSNGTSRETNGGPKTSRPEATSTRGGYAPHADTSGRRGSTPAPDPTEPGAPSACTSQTPATRPRTHTHTSSHSSNQTRIPTEL